MRRAVTIAAEQFRRKFPGALGPQASFTVEPMQEIVVRNVRPALLILDEPTSALDPLSRLKMRELLLQHRSRGKSIFLSSHQLSEIELICDRVIFIQKGRVIAGGHTQELLRDCGEFEITASGLRLAPPQAQKSHVQDGHLVFLTTAAQQRRSIEQVWSAGGTVVSVVPKTRTMEELFVELMTNSESTRGKTQ